jgi:hypothetical protein
MFWRLGGQFVVVGGWLVQAQGTPQNSINTFSYYTRIDSVLYRMGRLRSPYDPSLVLANPKYVFVCLCVRVRVLGESRNCACVRGLHGRALA